MFERQQRFRLGLFVLVSLGLLAALVVVFGGGPSWFVPRNQYTILFTDAPGLGTGTPVRKSGVKVGEVTAVNLDNETGMVRATVRLIPNFTPRTSDDAIISRGLIVGDTSIDFVPKMPEKKVVGEAIPPGSEIVGIAPFNTRALITQASDVVPEAQRSMEQIRKSLESLEKLGPKVETTLNEFTALARSAREFIPEIRKTNDALRDLLTDEPTPAEVPETPEQKEVQENVAIRVQDPAANPPPKVVPKAKEGKFNLREIRQAFQDIQPLIRDFRQLTPEIKETAQEVRYFLKTATFWLDDIGVKVVKLEPKLTQAIDAFTATAQSVNKTLSPENQKSITESLKNVQSATAKLDRLALSAEDLMKDGKMTLKTINGTLGKADQAMDDIRQVTKPLAENIPRLMKQLDETLIVAARSIADVSELVKAIGRSEGTFQKLISDPTLYNNLTNVTYSIGKLLPRLDRILQDVETFADKIARHPESLGVGGAIRPSSGLKEAPATLVPRPRNP